MRQWNLVHPVYKLFSRPLALCSYPFSSRALCVSMCSFLRLLAPKINSVNLCGHLCGFAHWLSGLPTPVKNSAAEAGVIGEREKTGVSEEKINDEKLGWKRFFDEMRGKRIFLVARCLRKRYIFFSLRRSFGTHLQPGKRATDIPDDARKCRRGMAL